MRLLVVSACVAAMTTGPALANPHALLSIVPDVHRVRASAPPRELPRAERLGLPAAPKRHLDGEIEMPWIWQVLRDHVYARMPRYEQPRRFALVVSPVVVTSPSDTIPGVGVAGSF